MNNKSESTGSFQMHFIDLSGKVRFSQDVQLICREERFGLEMNICDRAQIENSSRWSADMHVCQPGSDVTFLMLCCFEQQAIA